MKILFLDAYFYPEQIAFTHLENNLLLGLVERGHKIEVICPIPTRGISEDVSLKYRKIKSENMYAGKVHITRFYAPQEKSNPYIRFLRYIWCNYRTYQIGKKIEEVDVIFTNSTPPTQGLVAGSLSKKLRVPFVYSLQDIFPDSLVNAGMTKKGSFIWKIGKKIENSIYAQANSIITISSSFKEQLVLKKVPSNKIKVIPNWIDTTDVYPIKKEENKIIKKYGLNPNCFYICYCGNIGRSQNLELLIEVAKEIENKNLGIEFIFIGDGVAKEEFLQQIHNNMITNVHLLPFQPYEDIAHVFSLGDVGLIISKPGVGKSSVPSKTWSIMAAQRPVLASFDLDGDLFEIISKSKCGIIVEAGNKEKLINAIVDFWSKKDLRSICAEAGRKYVAEINNKTECVRKYIEVIENANSKNDY